MLCPPLENEDVCQMQGPRFRVHGVPLLAIEEPDPAEVLVWTLPPGEQLVWPRCELPAPHQLDRAPPIPGLLTLAGVSHHQGACPAPT